MKNHTMTLVAILAFYFCHAQHSISGIIIDEENAPISFANVLLLNPSDSSLVRGAITKDDGSYLFQQIPAASYLISTSIVGYDVFYTSVFDLGSEPTHQIDPIKLSMGVALKEVEVVAKKPLYEQKIDRMVINVENSITSAGSTALEILERSPGVAVNRQNGNISLIGKQGVMVMINDKVSYMPISGVIQMLEGMSADNIESIELITTPPANFDAEGNAGFINIKLKKRTDKGINGSYSLSFGYGRGGVTNSNLSFNYRKDRINLFGSYSFLWENQSQIFLNRRMVFDDGNTVDTEIFSKRDPIQLDHNARFGVDYQITDNTIIGALITGYDQKWTMDAANESVNAVNNTTTSIIRLLNTERNQWQHFSGNLNLRHDFSPDAYLSVDADYLHYYDENPNDYTNRFFEGNNNFLFEELTRSNKITPIDILVGKADYSHQISDPFKLQFGIKAVQSTFENDVSVETLNDMGNWVPDPELTNNSDLHESIFAIYSAADYILGDKTSLKVGLRYEYSDSKLDTEKEGRVVDRQFGQLFPSAFLSHNFNDNHGVNLSYSKRITRPTFSDMAPFIIFIDPNTFFAGNTGIQPAITDNYKIDYRYKSAVLSVQYSVEDSTISRFQERVETESNKLFFEPRNLQNTKVLSISLGFPWTVTSWWEMRNNFLFVDQEVNSFYLDEQVRFSQSYFQINSTQSFSLPQDFSMEVSLIYFGPQVNGISKVGEFYSLNAGLQKQFGDRWGTLRFNVNDILNSFKWKWSTNIPGQPFSTFSLIDFTQTTFTLSYTRNFGNQRLKSSRNRTLGSDEERRRVN